jgi:hypothetical protein
VVDINTIESRPSLAFSNIIKIYGIIGTYSDHSEAGKIVNSVICVVPGKNETTTVQLLRLSSQKNINFYKNFSKLKKSGIYSLK